MKAQRAPAVAVVSVSGGKDSTATALLAIERYGRERVRLVHADTGNEHELTESYVREYMPRALGLPVEIVKADFSDDIARKRRYVGEKWAAKGVPPDTIEAALSVLHATGNPFLDLCVAKGRFPSPRAQFCTGELKRRPLDAFMLRLMSGGETVESWQGVRRDESLNRRNILAREAAAEGWFIERPIADWTAQSVVDFIRSQGLDLNPLYSLGADRVGCMLCINAMKAEISNAARRFPGHIEKLRRWEEIVSASSKRGFSTFFYDGTDAEESDAETFERLRIDARVLWAKTSRGGEQYDLMKSAPPPACSSSYGLCE